MEDVLNDWKRFSLLEEETNRVSLEENSGDNEVILAAKFMTKRALNIEAIGRTLKPLWKTKNGFEIRDVGNHILLFVFDNEHEAERILATEPWTYDKHLIILSRYDGASPVRSIRFQYVKFWVQIHGLPVNRLNEKTAYEIGSSLGEVSKAAQVGELIGGDFLRVRVAVNVSRPLNRGRKVLLGKDGEVWVNFRYEKLPNFCYWCGMVSHGAQECSVWLASKGTLPLDQQEFGAWLRADLFSAGKKSCVFVSGTGDDFGGKDGPAKGRREHGRRQQATETPQTAMATPVNSDLSTERAIPEIPDFQAPISQTFQADNVNEGLDSCPVVLPGTTHETVVDFDEQIRDIDMELNKYDSHEVCVDNPDFQVMLSPIKAGSDDVLCTINGHVPLPQSDVHGSNTNPRDHEGINSGLRTWKRLARLNQNMHPAMHVPTLGKRNIECKDNEDTNQAAKRVQVSDGEHLILAATAVQSRQSQ